LRFFFRISSISGSFRRGGWGEEEFRRGGCGLADAFGAADGNFDGDGGVGDTTLLDPATTTAGLAAVVSGGCSDDNLGAILESVLAGVGAAVV